jgi:hypothetical protein
MITRRQTARKRTEVAEFKKTLGVNISRNGGSGREPIALSTAILSGKGVRRVKGIKSRLSNITPAM